MHTTQKPVRTAIYARLSRDPDGEEVAVARQIRDCQAIARRRGWTVTDVLSDNSLSAWRTDVRRPGWETMLRLVETGAVDAVLSWHGDRLIRQPRDLEKLIDLADRGLRVASASGERDVSDPDDRFILRIEVAAACKSSDDTSRRVRRVIQERVENGQRAGGAVPYGWRTPAEADVVRRICAALLAGRSARAVARELNAAGIPAAKGGEWDKSAVRWAAKRPANAGLNVHKGVVVGAGDWPAIITVEEHERLARLLAPGAAAGAPATRRWLLTGLAVCGRCGAPLEHSWARPSKKDPEAPGIYRCSATPHLNIRTAAADRFVLDVLQARLDRPDGIRQSGTGGAGDIAGLRQQLLGAQERREALGEDYASGLISREAMRAGVEKADHLIKNLQAELATLEQAAGVRAGLPTDIYAAPLDAQRAAIKELMNIVVQPVGSRGPRWTPASERVAITWK